MKIFISDHTVTFPFKKESINVDKLKGLKLEVNGRIITLESIELRHWIVSNCKKSFKVNNSCFIFNKQLIKAFDTFNFGVTDESIFDLIRSWAKKRGIYDKGDVKTQFIKLQEETGEIAKAILKQDKEEIIDGIGDVVVVLTNLAELAGLKIEDCIESAYNEISHRKGKMINGTFEKENK